jgi:hypothetical protein
VVSVIAAAGLLAGGGLAVFGLPPVDLHGPLHYLGMMDPFCGGTRGMHALMSGDLATAWRYNPITFPLVIGAVAVLVRHLVGLASGRWLNVATGNRRVLWSITVVAFVALGINQQLHADLLRTPPGRFSIVSIFLLPLLYVALGMAVYLLVYLRVRHGARARASGHNP